MDQRAPVAQLDRACGYEPQGREFESLRARHWWREVKTSKEIDASDCADLGK